VPPLQLDVTALAAGGDGIAREESGRVVFVAGALPGERVEVTLAEEKKDFARAVIDRVVAPAAERVAPPCPFVAEGCGACDWQHVDASQQRRLKAGIVTDALRRIAKIDHVEVGLGPDLHATGYRTTVRGVVDAGSFGFRRRRSHDPIAVDPCLVAHPLMADLISLGQFGDATEVTLRVGGRTGERLALLAPTADGAALPDDVRVIGADALAKGKRAWMHEEVAGRRYRISARSFFQGRPDGAEALIDLARAALPADLAPGSTLVDLYAGVGLFGAALGEGHRVVAVEHSASSVADARINLADRDARIVQSDVERWRPSTADVVIADPPRAGLGADGVRVVAGTAARSLVLVSCDPASHGRDAKLLTAAGFTLRAVTLVDLFPMTSHVEVLSSFDR
jgi:23S rRNA (uracil1939-C5)-methyltransferase